MGVFINTYQAAIYPRSGLWHIIFPHGQYPPIITVF
jgi:hypothetical protein